MIHPTKKIEDLNKLERFLHELVAVNPFVILPLFLDGQCYQLINIVKVVFEDAEHYTDDRFAHSYIKWNGDYYDITGKIDMERLNGIPLKPAPSEDENGMRLVYGPNLDDKRTLFRGNQKRELSHILHKDFYKNQYKRAESSQVPMKVFC